MKRSKRQHNKLSPSWNVFLRTPPLLLFCWPTVTLVCTGSTCLSTAVNTEPIVCSLRSLGAQKWVRRERVMLKLETAAAVVVMAITRTNLQHCCQISKSLPVVNWRICCSCSKCAIIHTWWCHRSQGSFPQNSNYQPHRTKKWLH